MGPCTVVAVTDTKMLVSFDAGSTGYDVVHRYEAAVGSIVRKKFDAALKPLLLPPPTVPGEPRASFHLMPDTLVFHESPEDVRDVKCVEPGATVHVIVQLIGIRRVEFWWELDTAVTQVYIPPKKKEPTADDKDDKATQSDGPNDGAGAEEADGPSETNEANEANGTGEPEGANEGAGEPDGPAGEGPDTGADKREMDEMLTTEVEQDVESFWIG
jgi:hypothetical protein